MRQRVVRRGLVSGAVVVLAAVLLSPGVGSAAGHPRIHSHQYFAGSVNGSLGQPGPAVIRVVCPGPSVGGRTGHPLPGQTVDVSRAIPTASSSGYTGDHATSISVFFGAPPPSAAGTGPVSLTRYDTPKAIPRSLDLPCGGSGVVTFVPLPQSPPTSRSEGVPAEYANVAAASTR